MPMDDFSNLSDAEFIAEVGDVIYEISLRLLNHSQKMTMCYRRKSSADKTASAELFEGVGRVMEGLVEIAESLEMDMPDWLVATIRELERRRLSSGHHR